MDKSPVSAKVKVDNTAPVIKTNIEKNKEYKGLFTIEAEINDTLAGVETSEIKLDDDVISSLRNSIQLISTRKTYLTITAVDKVGTKQSFKFLFP